MTFRFTRRGRGLLGFAVAAGLLLPGAARAQFLDFRLARIGFRPSATAGSMRLEAMGGLSVVGQDENNEIDLFDYDGNVAGLLEDRDATSTDFWYSNVNYLVPAAVGVRDDANYNRGGFLAVYRSPLHGVGVSWNYAELSAKDETGVPNRIKRAGYTGLYSARIGNRVQAGLRANLATENERNRTKDLYRLTHDTVGGGGGGALAFRILPQLVLAVRGDAGTENVSGKSTSVFHTDEFTWARPTKEGAVSAFVDLGPKARGGASVGRFKLEGREDVTLSWSVKFFFNPTLDVLKKDRPSLSEDLTTTTARTRWAVYPIENLELGAAYDHEKTDYTVMTVANVIGSLGPEDRTQTDTQLTGGAGYTFLKHRAFLGLELRHEKAEVESRLGDNPTRSAVTRTAFHLGGEWLLNPSLAARIGFINRSDSRDEAGASDVSSRFLTAGVGVLPLGGLIELNATYSRVLDSDESLEQNTVSLYSRILF